MKAKLSFFSERSHIMTEELTFLNLKLTFLKISKTWLTVKKTQISNFLAQIKKTKTCVSYKYNLEETHVFVFLIEARKIEICVFLTVKVIFLQAVIYLPHSTRFEWKHQFTQSNILEVMFFFFVIDEIWLKIYSWGMIVNNWLFVITFCGNTTKILKKSA